MHQAVIAMTKQKDAILLQSPLYKPLEKSILANNRKLIENKLIFDNKTFKIDFDDFEKQIKTHNIKIFMLCNPHNPGGVQW
ncbi:Cystathionine beta-lyase PatB, partial [Mycoplasma putrefaciens]